MAIVLFSISLKMRRAQLCVEPDWHTLSARRAITSIMFACTVLSHYYSRLAICTSVNQRYSGRLLTSVVAAYSLENRTVRLLFPTQVLSERKRLPTADSSLEKFSYE